MQLPGIVVLPSGEQSASSVHDLPLLHEPLQMEQLQSSAGPKQAALLLQTPVLPPSTQPQLPLMQVPSANALPGLLTGTVRVMQWIAPDHNAIVSARRPTWV